MNLCDRWLKSTMGQVQLHTSHVHYKFNMATKTAQICDQPKECEESGRKCLCMFASCATKLVTEP